MSSQDLEKSPISSLPRRGRLALALAASIGLCFVLMANEHQLRIGVPLGTFAVLVAAFALPQLLRRATKDEPVTASTTFGKKLALTIALLMAHLASIALATSGNLPLHRASAALLVTGSFIGLLIATFQALQAAQGKNESPLRHHGFWLALITSVLYLPMLGNFGLIDPWETHYGEVARELVARDDWISLWWAQDGWFFTKPILNFWMQALSFKMFGVHHMPDQMLSGAGRHFSQPEWAARLPVFWSALAAAYVLYKATARNLGKNAALCGGVILAGSPYWFLLARQTMADMPYVAPVTAAMGFLLLGFNTDSDRRVRTYRLPFGKRHFELSAYHLLMGAVIACVLPQIIYLATRNITLHFDVSFENGSVHFGKQFGFHIHADELERGSGGGNCGQAGNKSCRAVSPLWPLLQPIYAAGAWLLTAAVFVWHNRKEHRLQRFYFIAAWLCTAIAFMAKGAPGLVIPLAVALVYPIVVGKPKELARIELPALGLLLACVALPWFVQMFARHGMPFIERLFIHDMVKRAFAHVHDTNKGDDVSFRYYIWQLGYGLFPWTGIATGGLFWWARKKHGENKEESRALSFVLIWFLVAFGMFTITLTKFHHYILPLIPPIAVFSGVLMKEFLPKCLPRSKAASLGYFGGILAGATLCLYGVMRFFPGSLTGASGDSRPAAVIWLGSLCLCLGIITLVAAVRFFGPMRKPEESSDAPAPESEAARFDSAALSVIAIMAALALTFAGLDMVTTIKGDVEGQIRLLHLFTYEYSRPWPKTVHFGAPLAAFIVFSVVTTALLAVPKIRQHMGVVFTAGALLWTIWCVDIYLVQIEPHWGQRNTMLAYYKNRKDASEPLVAYQMNWKGENFYTGNKMATFVSSGKKFKRWVKKQRKRGVDTMFFVTEHSRIRTLKRELDNPKGFTQLTYKKDNNKFFMSKVEFEPLSEKDKRKNSKKPKFTGKHKGKGKRKNRTGRKSGDAPSPKRRSLDTTRDLKPMGRGAPLRALPASGSKKNQH